jgi:hypothetical protein
MQKKISVFIRSFLFLIFWAINFSGNPISAQELKQVPAAIQISSAISDGKYTISEIAEIVKRNQIKVVVMTDLCLVRLEYGLWPLRNLIKKTAEYGSVFKYGISRYLNQIKNAQRENPEMVIISGIEAVPLYYWQGNVFKRQLTIKNWHKHILVIGLDTLDEYKHLPIIGNPHGLKTKFQLYKLWPIILILSGYFCFKKRKYNYSDFQGRTLGPSNRKWQFCGLFLFIIGGLFL